MQTKEVVIVSAVRTAVARGKKDGSLAATHAVDLSAAVMRAAVERVKLDPALIDDVLWGCAMPEASQGLNTARLSVLRAGFPVEVSAATINRFCSSGLQTVAMAAQAIMTGMGDVVMAGGIEMMSAVPMSGFHTRLHPDMAEQNIGMGFTAERVATRWNITREMQDQYSLGSQQKAAAAWARNAFADQIVPVTVQKVKWKGAKKTIEESTFATDELVRASTTIEGLAKLPPAFKPGGSVTAGNSSPLSDGAAAILMMSADKAKELGIKPLARFVHFATAGVEPDVTLAIARTGGRCIITERTDWLGGQLTSQAVPPDENRWIEGEGGVQSATQAYLDFRAWVREWYRQSGSLTEAAKNNRRLNPGNGWVSHLCFRPGVGETVLRSMLLGYTVDESIVVLDRTEPVSADVVGDRIRAVTVLDHRSGRLTTITAKYFLDATELGDLLPLAKVEYAVGAEGRDVHGELHAPEKSDPFDQQAISWCFAIEHRPGENHTIPKPARYDIWRDYLPPLRPGGWPGKLFSWTVVGGDEHTPRTFRFIPWPDEPNEGELEMWRYRRIVDASIHQPGSGYTDVSLINMVQMDYFQKPTLDVSPEARNEAFADARQQSLAFLYWMQTEAPRHDSDTKTGYPSLKLRGDVLGTEDGFAKYPYIRESRRLKARTIVTERHVGVAQRKQEKLPDGAEPFADSVGIGHYRLDLHPSTAMRSSFYVETFPFRIPMGALIPIRVRNLLAAGKNLGVTHITNGCYRLHPIEWNVGEAAGLLAQHCVARALEPQQVHESPDRVQEFQTLAKKQGIPLGWSWENDAGL